MVPVRTVWRKHDTFPDVELIEHELTRERWLAGSVRPKGFGQVQLPSRIGAAAPAVAQRQTRVTPLLPPQPVPLVEHLLPATETDEAAPLRQAA